MASVTSLSAAESLRRRGWRRWLPASLRMRIAVSVTTVLLVLILAQALALVMLYEEMEKDFISDILAEQMAYSIERSRQESALVQPRTPSMSLFQLLPGEPLPDDLPLALATLPIGNHELHEGGREFHVAVREDGGARYLLRYDESEHVARVQALTTVVIMGGLVMSVLVLVLVHGIAGRHTGGLETLAARVGQGRGDTPFAGPGLDQELQIVARALDAADARQTELLARERNFTANLSHELRTPLAAIRTDAEMLLADAHLPDGARRRATRIVATIDRTTELANGLLLLAREARMQSQDMVNLAEAVRGAWAGLQSAGSPPVLLDLQIPATATLETDPALLHLVLRNLLENALRHGEGRKVSICLRGSRLCVQDRGPGFGAGEPMELFARFHQRGDKAGHGLGLALVRHICSACGWSVHAANRRGGGARVEIEFGAPSPG